MNKNSDELGFFDMLLYLKFPGLLGDRARAKFQQLRRGFEAIARLLLAICEAKPKQPEPPPVVPRLTPAAPRAPEPKKATPTSRPPMPQPTRRPLRGPTFGGPQP